MSTHNEKVHDFIRRKLDACSKSQVQIANEVGFLKPNVLSMIKAGRTPVPLSRITALANAIDVDPKVLFTMCLMEYKPGLYKTFQEIYELPSCAAETEGGSE